MGKLDELEFHDGCDNKYCPKCMTAHTKVAEMIDDALGERHDWLGKYHSWLLNQGIQPETDGGWWTREALNDKNVQQFIKEHAG